MALGSYVWPGIVTLVTVKVTNLVPLLSDGTNTMQVPWPPRPPVMHWLAFRLLTLHLPVTVAPFTGS